MWERGCGKNGKICPLCVCVCVCEHMYVHSGQGGVSEKMALGHRLWGSEGVSHVKIWRNSVLGRGNSMCKGPGMRAHLTFQGRAKKLV